MVIRTPPFGRAHVTLHTGIQVPKRNRQDESKDFLVPRRAAYRSATDWPDRSVWTGSKVGDTNHSPRQWVCRPGWRCNAASTAVTRWAAPILTC